ncbi:tRNA (cytidine(34)-2'-O)-methyltransferase [Thalassoporum mexicanum]|uniref:tRNA (cytidine(34)-2'-O)-methyltransferase n=1 Tax=Thalassoporum mexicanum TaxID=3457544 RepID=UPI0005A12E97
MLNVVLVYPEIPPNTGNIARTCAASQTPLHLVEPINFDISDRAVKRAGLDYWPYVDLHTHKDLDALAAVSGRWICFSAHGTQHFSEFNYQPNDWLLFGSESSGLPKSVLAAHESVYIPIAHPKVRSLNLSVCVALGLFEAKRQLGLL